MKILRPEDIRLEDVFQSCQLSSEYISALVKNVLSQIHFYHDIFATEFKGLYEVFNRKAEAGMINLAGDILFSEAGLRQYHDDHVAECIVAHEIAHFIKRHYRQPSFSLRADAEADYCLKTWGFNVDRFRLICGYPTPYLELV